jgi:predicted small lipoprotein YifL
MSRTDLWCGFLYLYVKGNQMKYSVLLAALLAFSMTACGKKEEAAAPVEAPAPEAVAPMEAAPAEAAPAEAAPMEAAPAEAAPAEAAPAEPAK